MYEEINRRSLWYENWQLVGEEAILLSCPLLQEFGVRGREQVISELEAR